jgi:hypothetical protein
MNSGMVRMRSAIGILAVAALVTRAMAGEKAVVSLKGFCDAELKSAGIELTRTTRFHIKALGGGGDYGWTYKSNEMFAYGWILDASTRKLVWKMDVDNTTRAKKERSFDDNLTLSPGSYEVYFAVPTFAYHTTFTHFMTNVDHRNKPLFGEGKSAKGKEFIDFFKNWWSDDITEDWEKRCNGWGIDLLLDDSDARTIKTFTPPRELPNVVVKVTGRGDDQLTRTGFSVLQPITLDIYALGEASGEFDMYDYSWIVNAATRERVWEMQWRKHTGAGGSDKNIECTDEITLPKGDYVLYNTTDDSHSEVDWNAPPPSDPYYWGTTISVKNERDIKNIKLYQYNEDQNVILSLTKMRDNEHRTEGFTLKQDAALRIYAFGERGNSRRSMADYATIVDANSRNKVWSMNVDHSLYAGGASKNRYIDEIISLPRGSYTVTYNTDDSHAYDEWNDKPPFDPQHYGITIMGTGEKFSKTEVARYVQQQDKNVIAQLTKVGDDANEEKRFRLDKTTRLRVYAIGEGERRDMYDYGWIENTRTGAIVWEMTYSMTFHAGGGRKNRMVNTTIILDKGEYKLHYKSDDSHSYGDWNVDPPEDQEFWGITLFRDGGTEHAIPPEPPAPPGHPEQLE